MWNTIFNPKTKKYVQINSTSGQKILNSYLDHVQNNLQSGGKKRGRPKKLYMGPCQYKSSTKRCSKGDKWNKEKCTKNINHRCIKIRPPSIPKKKKKIKEELKQKKLKDKKIKNKKIKHKKTQ